MKPAHSKKAISMKKHNICILGGTGFVGQSLAAGLVKQGHSVRLLCRRRERHRDLLVLPTVEIIKADIHDSKQLDLHFKGIDVVINLVGILNEKRDNGKGFHHVHVALTEKIIAVCKANNITRLLHMSALHADAELAKSYYLKTKGLAEDLVHKETSLNVTSFRPSVIFGARDSFTNRFAQVLKITPLVFPLACPSSQFAPVYVEDVAQAFIHCIDDAQSYGQRYDLCGPRTYRLLELVHYVSDLSGHNRMIIGLDRVSSWLQANFFQYVPGKPFSRDNYRSLQTDSICNEGQNDLQNKLQIKPTPLESVAPIYLGKSSPQQHYQQYRKQH